MVMSTQMNVGDLRFALEGVPDDREVAILFDGRHAEGPLLEVTITDTLVEIVTW